MDVAIKMIDMEKLQSTNKRLKKHLESEIYINMSLRHENIVSLREVIVEDDYIYLILDYCRGGDLAKYIKKRSFLSEDIAREFMRQLAYGLSFLRSKNIIHRDLKPHNLLLSSDDSTAVLKIADFGFARFISPQDLTTTLCGSPLYMAPEILMCKEYDGAIDLWSAGCILYEMLTGNPPFVAKTQYALVRLIEAGEVAFPSNLVGRVSVSCLDLLRRLLKKDAKQRISFDNFLSHPFLNLNPAKLLAESRRSAVRVDGLGQSHEVESTPPTLSMLRDKGGGDSTKWLGNMSDSATAKGFIEAEAVNYKKRLERAQAIFEMAPFRGYAECLAFYFKVLDSLKRLIEDMERSTLKNPLLLEAAWDVYDQCFEKAEKGASVINSDTEKLYTSRLLYAAALQMGREAAVAEELCMYKKCPSLYSQGLHLLQQLLEDATSLPDKTVICDYIARFSERLDAVNNKK
eukprot:TRINITY_DN11795_c0_g1_i1.p1 TRINITY_DN11795_c0_g1~~TRINITY_DN11795_c0_g1_i1.p1  ORF type:complete len:460 (-),score=86.07 TRINITY_DN11795_c0_g1_i1:79-1458(-)